MRGARLLRFLGGTLPLMGGLVMLPLPVPAGQPLTLAGLGLPVAVSPPVRNGFRALRYRLPWLSRRLDRVAQGLPGPLSRLIRATAPAQRAVETTEDRTT